MKNSKFNSIKVIAFLALLNFAFANSSIAQMKPSDGSKVSMSKYSYSETVDLLKGAIEEQNLMVISDIDAQKMLRMAGKEVKGMRQIFYFHPKYMRQVMEANPAATIQIPLKFIVMERPDNKVVVRYFMPSTILNQYQGEEEIAKELDGLVDKIIAEISN